MHLYTNLKTTILVISNVKSNPSQGYQTGAGDRPTHTIPIAWRERRCLSVACINLVVSRNVESPKYFYLQAFVVKHAMFTR